MSRRDFPFWRTKSLTEMNREEWESLCDGCGKCCLEKLQDAETGQVYYTNVACDLLDIEACRCTSYAERLTVASHCLCLTPADLDRYFWLPMTCAYRLLHEGKALLWWHPLISGDPETVHAAGVSIRDKVIGARHVHPDDLEAYILDCDI